ncbi:titin-like [Arapaima gigas]
MSEQEMHKVISPEISSREEEAEGESEEPMQEMLSPKSSQSLEKVEVMIDITQKIISPKVSRKASFESGEFQEITDVSSKSSMGKIPSEEITPAEVVSDEELPQKEVSLEEKLYSANVFKDFVQTCLKKVADAIRHTRGQISEKGPSEPDEGETPILPSEDHTPERDIETPEEITYMTPTTTPQPSFVSVSLEEVQVSVPVSYSRGVVEEGPSIITKQGAVADKVEITEKDALPAVSPKSFVPGKSEEATDRISFSRSSISEGAPSEGTGMKSPDRVSPIQTLRFTPDISPLSGKEQPYIIRSGARRVSYGKSPQSPDSRVWTLYHLAHVNDEGTLSTKVLYQPPFNGSAYIQTFGPGHVLLAKRSSHLLTPVMEPVRGHLSPGGGFRSVPSQPSSTDPSYEKSIPNYLLSFEDRK